MRADNLMDTMWPSMTMASELLAYLNFVLIPLIVFSLYQRVILTPYVNFTTTTAMASALTILALTLYFLQRTALITKYWVWSYILINVSETLASSVQRKKNNSE